MLDHPFVFFCNVKSYCKLVILPVKFQGLGVQQRNLMHELCAEQVLILQRFTDGGSSCACINCSEHLDVEG